MKLWWFATICFAQTFFISNSKAYVVWKKGASKPLKGEISIRHDLVAVGEQGQNSTEFKEHAQKFANMSLDEKCNKGLDLSVAFQIYTPYVDIKSNGKRFL